MGKDAAKPTKTRGGKARGALVEKTKGPEGEPVCNRRRRVVKRKATEGEGTSTVKSRRLSSPGKASCSTAVKDVTVGKRKAVADVEGADRRKKRRVALKETEPETRQEVTVGKRKVVAAVEGAVGAKKRRRDLKDTKQEAPKKVSIKALRAEFKARYQQERKLGEGAFGCVFAGYRREDSLPVAIKHVRKNNILYDDQEDAGRQIPIEVAVMLRLQEKPSSSVGASAPVALLDWYQLGQELILVHERPVPSEDLQHHIRGKGGSIPEGEAKIIFKQLVDAAVDLQNKQVFHRDIHQANILIQTGSDVPRVRVVDFGVSCFAKEGDSFHKYLGNSVHAAPECRRQYRAGPFTVWQIGTLLYEALHTNTICLTKKFLKGSLKIGETLSEECQDFLRLCLVQDPEERATLDRLRVHAWLQ